MQGHWFIERALSALLKIRSWPGLERPTSFGPKLITRLLVGEGLDPKAVGENHERDGARVKDVFVCPTRFFFPHSYGEDYDPARVTHETFGIHFYAKSWEKDLPRWVRLARSVRSRAKGTVAAEQPRDFGHTAKGNGRDNAG